MPGLPPQSKPMVRDCMLLDESDAYTCTERQTDKEAEIQAEREQTAESGGWYFVEEILLIRRRRRSIESRSSEETDKRPKWSDTKL